MHRYDGSRTRLGLRRVLKDAVRLATPVRYRHPPGAIIWVKLEHPVVC